MIASQDSTSTGFGNTRSAPEITILNVHGIGSADRPLDAGEDRTWVTVQQFESVLDAVAGRSDVRITFDDGNISDLEIGLPRLLSRGLTAEFFVLAGKLGERGRLDAGAVRALLDAGMRVGSHGWAHRDWRRLTSEQLKEEYTAANWVLGDVTGSEITRVAVPFGSYDRHVLRHLRRGGVTRVFTSDGGRSKSTAWLQPRNSLRSDIGPEWIRNVIDRRPAISTRIHQRAARMAKRVRG